MLTETDWSDKSSDAFWEMVNNQLLVAKVTLIFKLFTNVLMCFVVDNNFSILTYHVIAVVALAMDGVF